MTGGRYTDWAHIVVAGNRSAGARHVPYARKLLGFVMDEAQRNGLGVYKAERTLDDGTRVVAEKHGSIPRVTIIPGPAPQPKRPIRTFNDFVFGAANSGRTPDGEVVNPAVILSYRPDSEDWAAYFRSGSSPGKDASTAPHVATYGDTFTFTSPDEELLTNTRTWIDSDGNACAWFSPVGPFEAMYRHPATLYANTVSALGHAVLGLAQEAYEAGWRVVSAARKGDAMFVLFGQLGALPRLDPTSSPAMNEVWATSMFVPDACAFQLIRVPLYAVDDPASGVRYLKPDTDGTQVLWSGGLIRCYGLWTFNEDCTEVVTYQLPNSPYVMVEPGPTTAFEPVFSSALAATSPRVSLQIGEASATLQVVNSATAVHEEYGRVLHLMPLDAYSLDYVCGEVSYPAYRFALTDEGCTLLTRSLIYADLRHGWYVFREWDMALTGSNYGATEKIIVAGTDGEAEAYSDEVYGMVYAGFKDVVRSSLEYLASVGPSALHRAYATVAGVFQNNASATPDGIPTSWIAAAQHLGVADPMPADAQGATYGGIKISGAGGAWNVSLNYSAVVGAPEDYVFSPGARAFNAACSTADALALQTTKVAGEIVHFLTKGELPGYYGGDAAMGGSPRAVGVYLLGRPLPSQPLEREAA